VRPGLTVRGPAAGFTLALCSAALLSCRPPAPAMPAPADVLFRAPSQAAILKFPEHYDSAQAYPLLVALHGNGGTAAEFDSGLASLDRASLLVAVPQGEYARAGGGYSWFLETPDRSLWEANDTRTVDHVVELVGAIGARYRVGKVFVLGFSAGASLAYMTGLRNPSLVTGILAIGGHLPEIDREGSILHAEDLANGRSVRVFIARGMADPYVGQRIFTNQRDFLASRGFAVTAYEYVGAHHLTSELLARVARWIRRYAGN
jgi:phospholipase/carboxylesterase